MSQWRSVRASLRPLNGLLIPRRGDIPAMSQWRSMHAGTAYAEMIVAPYKLDFIHSVDQ